MNFFNGSNTFFGPKLNFWYQNTPGTAGGPGGRDRTLTVIFFCIYLLVMSKYWGKQIFTHGSFLKVGQKQKKERKEMVITMARYAL